MGFGCNVPAIMATRTLENRKDRILTMLMLPFMSCSAKLPVYVLLISAFFPTNQGLVLVSIYLIGIFIAILTALVLRKYLFKDEEVPFVMELPPYRIPTFKNTTSQMWYRALQYLKKMGGIILVASILIWALGYFPRDVDFSKDYAQEIELINANNYFSDELKLRKISELEMEQKSEKQEKSYIGQMGKFIEPIIEPLGFDWKIGVSIIAGLAAKEIIVSTMGVLYYSSDANSDEVSNLQTNLQSQKYQSGQHKDEKIFTPLVAYGLMIFVLLYFPCVATITAIRKESNTKWAFFAALYTTTVAWLVAFLVHQIGSLF
jgi:ferrous iron transport protein B